MWIYYAYNWDEHKYRLYLKFFGNDRVVNVVQENVVQMVPNYLGVHIGGDPFHKMWNG
jgi:hypothetical protein